MAELAILVGFGWHYPKMGWGREVSRNMEVELKYELNVFVMNDPALMCMVGPRRRSTMKYSPSIACKFDSSSHTYYTCRNSVVHLPLDVNYSEI